MRRAHVAAVTAGVGAILIGGPEVRADAPDDRPRVEYQTLVLSSDPAPGTAGQAFSHFPYHSFVGDGDHTVFLASVNAPSRFAQPNGLFINVSGQTSLVAKADQPAPGFAPGVEFQSFDVNYHRANRQGQVVFESTLHGPGILGSGDNDTNAWTNWFYSDGKLTNVAQWGGPAAGVPGAVYRNFDRTTLNDLGQVAFHGVMKGPTVTPDNDSAMWFGTPGSLNLLMREGDDVPGRPGVQFSDWSGADTPVLSPGGKVAFNTGVRGPTFSQLGLSPTAVLAGTPGNLSVLAMTDEPAPGTTSTIRTTSTYSDVHVNNKAEALFGALLNDGTRTLYAGSAGNLRLVARTEQPAPGLPAGNSFSFFYGTDFNDRGDVAFHADVDPTGDDRHGIFLAKGSGSPTLVAVEGEYAPGAAYARFGNFFSDPVMNKDGQVAFFASLVGDASRGPDDYGIFATGHNDDLRLIARYGDTFEVAPGDVRTIQTLSYNGLLGTHVLSFNDDSDLSFMIRFTDGSEGIFDARVLPEPGCAGVIGVLVTAAGVRRRRRR
jgi:hypothetical protein